ncbi:hypothetical protein Cadr_000021605 [Camelus dromedarius]|uniref:Uncharacterized protein n=1 Tax=Camelus dromedarius TaxID=9838 RepID=A0A5N4CTR9_CAMDR|nr:hypothetical protein Cadr_000021605 [Camelus dromedarius]
MVRGVDQGHLGGRCVGDTRLLQYLFFTGHDTATHRAGRGAALANPVLLFDCVLSPKLSTVCTSPGEQALRKSLPLLHPHCPSGASMELPSSSDAQTAQGAAAALSLYSRGQQSALMWLHCTICLAESPQSASPGTAASALLPDGGGNGNYPRPLKARGLFQRVFPASGPADLHRMSVANEEPQSSPQAITGLTFKGCSSEMNSRSKSRPYTERDADATLLMSLLSALTFSSRNRVFLSAPHFVFFSNWRGEKATPYCESSTEMPCDQLAPPHRPRFLSTSACSAGPLRHPGALRRASWSPRTQLPATESGRQRHGRLGLCESALSPPTQQAVPSSPLARHCPSNRPAHGDRPETSPHAARAERMPRRGHGGDRVTGLRRVQGELLRLSGGNSPGRGWRTCGDRKDQAACGRAGSLKATVKTAFYSEQDWTVLSRGWQAPPSHLKRTAAPESRPKGQRRTKGGGDGREVEGSVCALQVKMVTLGSTITPRLCTWAGRQVSTDSSEGPSVKRSRDLAGPGLQRERRGGTGAPGREVAPALTLLCTTGISAERRGERRRALLRGTAGLWEAPDTLRVQQSMGCTPGWGFCQVRGGRGSLTAWQLGGEVRTRRQRGGVSASGRGAAQPAQSDLTGGLWLQAPQMATCDGSVTGGFCRPSSCWVAMASPPAGSGGTRGSQGVCDWRLCLDQPGDSPEQGRFGPHRAHLHLPLAHLLLQKQLHVLENPLRLGPPLFCSSQRVLVSFLHEGRFETNADI